MRAKGERMTEQWYGVWAKREGYAGHWHGVDALHPEPLQTTKTEATRVCAALNEFAAERTDSIGWSYEVQPYRETSGETPR